MRGLRTVQDGYLILFLPWSPHAGTRGMAGAGGAHRRSTSKNSPSPHSGDMRSMVKAPAQGSRARADFRAASGTGALALAPALPISSSPPSVTSFMLKEESAATRQGDNRCPGAEPSRSCYFVIFHSRGHVPDLADENQTYPLPRVFFFPPAAAAAAAAKCQLSPERESKYCDSPTSSTNVRGHW